MLTNVLQEINWFGEQYDQDFPSLKIYTQKLKGTKILFPWEFILP